MSIISRIFFLIFFISSSFADISVRTSIDQQNISGASEVYIAFDFKVPNGEHVTAPFGKGKSLSPSMKWKNAKNIDIIWPETVDLPESSGKKSEYKGYDKDFSLVYKVTIDDPKSPVEYDLFYVMCGEACRPIQKTGVIKFDGSLKDIPSQSFDFTRFIMLILFGLLGGMILNAMPCVFPIISMKIFGLIQKGASDQSSARKNGLVFSAGNIVSFMTIGSTLIYMRAKIPNIGWGFFMQEPMFITGFLIVFILCALNFFGIFHINIPTISSGNFLANKKEMAKSFFSGILSAFVSATCVGPFAGVAVAGAVLSGDTASSLAIFASLGLGVASPFLIVSFWPGFAKFLPKPGAWMTTFKEFMGFSMIFSSAWLIWVLSGQLSSSKFAMTIFLAISVAFFIWLGGKSSKTTKMLSHVAAITASVVAIYNANQTPSTDGIKWTEYSPSSFSSLSDSTNPVFVKFTAAWCLNCSFNESVFIDKKTIDLFKSKNITAIECDWTTRNSEIGKFLAKFGSASVPFYVLYPKGTASQHITLPTIISLDSIQKALEEPHE